MQHRNGISLAALGLAISCLLSVSSARASDSEPDSVQLQLKLAQALNRKREKRQAVDALNRANALAAKDPDLSNETLRELVATWETTILNDFASASDPQNLIGMGRANMLLGHLKVAKNDIESAIKFSPGKKNPTAEALLIEIKDKLRKN